MQTAASAGAATSGADASPASSTGNTTTTQPAANEGPSTLDIVRRARAGSAEPADTGEATNTDEDHRRLDGGTDAEDERTAGEAGGEDEDKGDQETEGMVPREKVQELIDKAVKGRVGKLNNRIRSLESDVRTKETTLKRSQKALELLAEEHERVLAAWQGGQAFDERDLELAQHRLEKRARESADALTSEQQKALDEEARKARSSEVSAQLANEARDAFSRYPLVAKFPAEFKAAWLQDPQASAEEVAAALDKKLRGELGIGEGAPDKPPAPRTVRKPGTSAPVHYSDDVEGITKRIKAIRARSS